MAATSSGLGGQGAVELINTLGLVAMILMVIGIYRLGIRGIHRIDQRRSPQELANQFAHTLVPIALAYVVAHYFTFLIYQGQSIGYLISDPLGNGANIFGTAHATIDYGFISASQAWYFEVAALLAGHVAGLVLAHDRAVSMFRHSGTPDGARVGPGGVLGPGEPGQRRDPLAVLDARRDGRLHLPGLWLLAEAA